MACVKAQREEFFCYGDGVAADPCRHELGRWTPPRPFLSCSRHRGWKEQIPCTELPTKPSLNRTVCCTTTWTLSTMKSKAMLQTDSTDCCISLQTDVQS